MKAYGRPHSGIDDTKNIARIVLYLLARGCVFDKTDNIQKMIENQTPKHPFLQEHVNEWASFGIKQKGKRNLKGRKEKCTAMKRRLEKLFNDPTWTANMIGLELDRLVQPPILPNVEHK